jgi:hypothetical protein
LQAGGRRFDPVWLHQPGGLIVRDLSVCVALRVATPLSDIVKRRSIRASTFDTRVPGEAREGFGSWTRMKSRAILSAGLTARRRNDLEASWSFLCNAGRVVLPVGFLGVPMGLPMGIDNESDQVP